MKIVLIHPSWWRTPGTFPTTSLVLLASFLRGPEYSVLIIDENLRPLADRELESISADLVGITVMTHSARRAYHLAGKFRSRGIPVVLGGWHVSACPDEAAEHADSIVIGEGEMAWPQLIDDFRCGRMKPRYYGGIVGDLSGLPVPAWELVDMRRYIPVPGMRWASYLVPWLKSFCLVPVQTRRGCPVGCRFCSVKGNVRFRPADEVRRELEYHIERGYRIFFIIDDNIGLHPRETIDMIRRFPRGMLWFSQFSINFARDDEMLAAFAESGCRGLFLGLESILPENIRAVHKGSNKPDEYCERIANIHRHGIGTLLSFIFGLPEDRPGVGRATAEFAHASGTELAAFNLLYPLPGTETYSEMLATGQFLPGFERYWLREDSRREAVFRHPNFSSEQLREEVRSAWEYFYGDEQMLERVRARPRHTQIFYLIFSKVFMGAYLPTERFGRELAALIKKLYGSELKAAAGITQDFAGLFQRLAKRSRPPERVDCQT